MTEDWNDQSHKSAHVALQVVMRIGIALTVVAPIARAMLCANLRPVHDGCHELCHSLHPSPCH